MTKPTCVPETLSLHVPFRIAKRGGRREVQVPPGAPVQRTRIDNSLVKALARAFRWQRMLEDGTHASVAEIAAAEKINQSYLCRVLRLTLLTPNTIKAILDGSQRPELHLNKLLKPFPVEWRKQVAHFS